MLLVGKIRSVAPQLFRAISPGEALRQVQQRQHGRRHVGKIRAHVLVRRGKALADLLAVLFAAVPQGLGPVFQGVLSPHGFQPIKREAARAGGVPSLVQPPQEILQRRAGCIKGRQIFFRKGLILGQFPAKAAQHIPPIGQFHACLFDQFLSIGCLRDLLGDLQPQLRLRAQPLLRIGMALQLTENLQHQRGQSTVVPPRADRVGQQFSAAAFFHIVIKCFQHPLEHLQAQQFRFLLIQHAEIRRQAALALAAAHQMDILPQQIGTE